VSRRHTVVSAAQKISHGLSLADGHCLAWF
jgi:hypothetical protein